MSNALAPAAAPAVAAVQGDVRMLLDGLQVEGLADLRRLVELGRAADRIVVFLDTHTFAYEDDEEYAAGFNRCAEEVREIVSEATDG